MPTLSKIKEILGITDTLQDTQLQSILDSALVIAESMIDISHGNKEIYMEKSYNRCNEIYGRHPNITSLVSIDSTDFSSKVAGVDYLIKPNGIIEVPSLSSYVTSDFSSYKVVYDAGYTTEPADYVLAIANYCGAMLGLVDSASTGAVLREKMGPREVQYAGLGGDDGSGSLGMTPQRTLSLALQHYIPLNLKYW